MVDLLRDRIKAILHEKNTGITGLVNGNDSQRCKISRQINGNLSVTLPTIMMILESFPDISAEYLLRGIGGMYVQDHLEPRYYNQNCAFAGDGSTQTVSSPSNASMQTMIDQLNQIISMKDETIRELKDDKRQLNTQLSMLLVKIKKQ